MNDDATSHAPDHPFGCTATWGEAVRDGGVHVCNLSNTHPRQAHECKCGATSEEPKPVPGPPVAPRCKECGGPRSVGGAIRYHESDCSIGAEGQRRAQTVRFVEDALVAAVRERRQDTAFMERLAARVATDKNILDRLAGGGVNHDH